MALTARRKELLSAGATGALALALTFVVIRFPDQAFQASFEGLQLWFEIVLPALLPFFVISEILMGLGVIRALGVLLEPIMQPAFRIPGVGAFAVAMGIVSGNPLGAKIAGQMRRANICSREEGERLIALSGTAGPLFLVGAVAVGIFHNASVGMTIVVAHYLAVLCVGFLLRFYGAKKTSPALRNSRSRGSIFGRALREMSVARKQDGRPFGNLLSDAVRESMASMIFIGGTIMMFSVFIRILTISGALNYFAAALGSLLVPLGLDSALITPLANGLIEMTIGAQTIGQAPADLLQRLITVGFTIGWSGLSIHTQVAAMIHGTDIRLTPYLVGCFLHGSIAASLTWLLFPYLGASESTVIPAATTMAQQLSYWGLLGLLTIGAVVFIGLLLLISLLVIVLRRIQVVRFRV